ncbi:MAG: hypothetical protein ABL863_10580 [Nitrosomonas sp.]
MATSQQKDNIIALVVATFNAAPGSKYLQDFSNSIDAGMSFHALANFFVTTDEFKNGILNGVVTNEEIAKKLLNNFGLTTGNSDPNSPDFQAEAFFIARLNQGISISDIIIDAGLYLLGTPAEEFKALADLFQNKITVAKVYSNENSANDLSELQGILIGVTPAFPKTEVEAKAFIDNTDTGNEPGTGNELGKIFTLTPDADQIKGTSGNDTLNGVAGSFNPSDSLDGGGGRNDTLNITLSDIQANSDAVSVKNIETLGVTLSNPLTANTILNAELFGVNNIIIYDVFAGAGTGKDTLSLTNLPNNANVTFSASSATVGTIAIEVKSAIAGTSEGATIIFGQEVDFATLPMKINAEGLETINLATSTIANNPAVVTLLAELNDAQLTTLNVNGSDGIKLINLKGASNIATINASGVVKDANGKVGGVTFNLSGNNAAITFSGGQGDDTYTGTNNGDFITGSLGTDNIALGTSSSKDILFYNDKAESNGITVKDLVSNFDVTADILHFSTNMQMGAASYIQEKGFENTGSTQLRFDEATQTLEIDLDGNAVSDMGITLTGINNVHITDGLGDDPSTSFGTNNFIFS